VELAAAEPGHVGVQRFARQGMAKGAAAGRRLHHEAAVEQLGEAGLARKAGDQVELEFLAGHGGHIRHRAGLVGKLE
jgi:hypothetical protein